MSLISSVEWDSPSIHLWSSEDIWNDETLIDKWFVSVDELFLCRPTDNAVYVVDLTWYTIDDDSGDILTVLIETPEALDNLVGYTYFVPTNVNLVLSDECDECDECEDPDDCPYK
jgi:hypothetical protein